jgi:hypothetical protein
MKNRRDIPDEQPDEVANLLGVVLPEAGDSLPNLSDLSGRISVSTSQRKNGLSMDESINGAPVDVDSLTFKVCTVNSSCCSCRSSSSIAASDCHNTAEQIHQH